MTTGIWPSLKWTDWQATADTLHMWTQIVGKTRLALSPLQAHWWNVPLYVSARGLNTSAMPYGAEFLEITFDFVSHELKFAMSTGASLSTPLRAQSVAEFYREYQRSLAALGVSVDIHPVPVELQHPIPFTEDLEHASYDPQAAHRFWRVLMHADRVFQQFSSRFRGQSQPGTLLLGQLRSGGHPLFRPAAPPREGADAITREAYSHEVISAGFWPGNGGFGEAAFYCYAAPAPKGLENASIQPAKAVYNKALGEFIYLYEDLRHEPSPDDALLAFLQSSYEAGATLANGTAACSKENNN